MKVVTFVLDVIGHPCLAFPILAVCAYLDVMHTLYGWTFFGKS